MSIDYVRLLFLCLCTHFFFLFCAHVSVCGGGRRLKGHVIRVGGFHTGTAAGANEGRRGAQHALVCRKAKAAGDPVLMCTQRFGASKRWHRNRLLRAIAIATTTTIPRRGRHGDAGEPAAATICPRFALPPPATPMPSTSVSPAPPAKLPGEGRGGPRSRELFTLAHTCTRAPVGTVMLYRTR